jgi:hypothetical protein
MKCQKPLLVLLLVIFSIPHFLFINNQTNGYDTYQRDISILEKIDLPRIYNITNQLSSYHSRLTGTLDCNLAASDIYLWLKNTYNITDSFFEDFIYNKTPCLNVIARINGTNLKNEIVIISAHYDSISNSLSDGTAPGTNDNAVAVAVCMEVMGVIQNYFSLNRTLLFISYAGEEQAFIGSQAWINKHKDDLSHVVAVINLDMIGFGSHLSIIKNDQSDWLADTIITASSLIDVTFTKSNSPYPENARFDHETFWLVQIPSVTLFEAGAIYPYYHTSEDTIDKISFDLVEKCAQVTLLSILQLGVETYQHNWSIFSLVIWFSFGIAAIVPFILYRKIK